MSNLNDKTMKYLTSKYELTALNEETFKQLLNEVSEISGRVPRKERLQRDLLQLRGVNGWNERVEYYNQVIKNVFKKLQRSAENLLVPDNAKVLGLQQGETGVLLPLSQLTLDNFPVINDSLLVVFSYQVAVMKPTVRYKVSAPALETKSIKLPITLFRNDPISIAQYVREIIGQEYRKYVKEDIKDAIQKVEDLKKQLERAESFVQESTALRDKLDSFAIAKSERKLAARREKKELLTS